MTSQLAASRARLGLEESKVEYLRLHGSSLLHEGFIRGLLPVDTEERKQHLSAALEQTQKK